MRAFIGAVITEFVAALILLGAAAVTGALAWLEDAPWHIVALAVLAAVALTFLLLNQFRGWWAQRRVNSDRWLEDSLPKWLTVGNRWLAPRGPPSDDTILDFVVENRRADIQGEPLRVRIFVLKEQPESLLFETSVRMEDQEFALWDDHTRGRWRRDIDIELAKFGVGFGDVVTADKDWTIRIEVALPRESLTKLALSEQVWRVERASVLVREMVRRFVDLTPAGRATQSTPQTEGAEPEQAPEGRP